MNYFAQSNKDLNACTLEVFLFYFLKNLNLIFFILKWLFLYSLNLTLNHIFHSYSLNLLIHLKFFVCFDFMEYHYHHDANFILKLKEKIKNYCLFQILNLCFQFGFKYCYLNCQFYYHLLHYYCLVNYYYYFFQQFLMFLKGLALFHYPISFENSNYQFHLEHSLPACIFLVIRF